MQLTIVLDTTSQHDVTLLRDLSGLLRVAKNVDDYLAEKGGPVLADTLEQTAANVEAASDGHLTVVPAAEQPTEKRGRGRPRKQDAAAPAPEPTPEPSAVREPETAEQQPEPVVNLEPTPEPVAEAAPEPSADDFDAPAAATLDDLRAQVRLLLGKNSANKDKISGVLKSFGANLLPDLKASDYGAVLAQLKAIA